MKIFTVLLLSFLFVGCSILQDSDRLRIPLTYATFKVIERDNDISSQDVLQAMDRLESLINDDFDIRNEIKHEVIERLDLNELSQSDRFLVLELLDLVEQNIRREVEMGVLAPEDVKIRVGNLIDVVRQAALMH